MRHCACQLVIAGGQGLLGINLIALAAATHLAIAIVWMVVVGFLIVGQLFTTDGFLRTTASSHLRGRMVSLHTWPFSGLAPIGGLTAGWPAQRLGARLTAAGAGLACAAFAAMQGGEMLFLRHRLARWRE